MPYSFYPRCEDACPKVACCPHLGGAAVASVVLIANENEDSRRSLLATIDAERKRNSELVGENQRLQRELDQAKLELKLERQNKFTTNAQKQHGTHVEPTSSAESGDAEPRKRGAPMGHPGWFRATPQEYDWDVDVPVAGREGGTSGRGRCQQARQ